MSRDTENFYGLHEIPYPHPSPSSTRRSYRVYPDGGVVLTADTHPCDFENPFFPFNTYSIDCPGVELLANTPTYDLMDATRYMYMDDSESLADWAAIKTPDFVQVKVTLEAQSEGGNNACAVDAGRPDGCAPPLDGEAFWSVDATADAYFPWEDPDIDGNPEPIPVTAGQLPINTRVIDLLRRPVDGQSYTGEPENEGTDTLIPWSEFVSNPTITLGITSSDVYRLSLTELTVTVYPWYRDAGSFQSLIMFI